MTMLPTNRDTHALNEDPPAGAGHGARWLRAAGAVAGVAVVLVLGRAAVLPILASAPETAAVTSAAADPAQLLAPPPAPSTSPDPGDAPGDAIAPPAPVREEGQGEALDGSAGVELRTLPDGSLTLRVREASPGTQVWLPGGVHLIITEGNQVRLLDPVPDGVVSPEQRPRG